MIDGFPRKFGKYHLLMPLAQGGMGALYLAVAGDRGLEKLCVIKTVLPHLADAEYVQRFRDEAKVVVKLSHGNLVPVFDAGQVGGEIFLAMEYVEGKDLRAVWNRCAKKGVAFPVDVAVYIVKELCRGLAYAHGFGELKLVHRDVSPPNVLISFAGEIKLTDFGLANSTLKVEKTAPGVIYGKVSYMSPEQARGESLDGRTDLYAAGIVLWELLTGRQLFPPGESQPQDLVLRARNPKVDPPSRRAPRVPGRLDEVVLKALAPDRDDRFQNGEEMRAALAGWLATEAPATDSARLEKFVLGLFADDMTKERNERESMIEMTRDRIRPDHEGGRVGAPVRPQRTRKGAAVVPEPGPGGQTFVQSYGSSAAVAVHSDGVRPSLERRLWPKCVTVYNGIDPPLGKPRRGRAELLAAAGLSLDEGVPLAVAVGSIVPMKGIHHLIEAAAQVSRRMGLVVVGDAPQEWYRVWLERRVAELGLRDVRFPGWDHEATDWIAAADVVCLPTVDQETMTFDGVRRTAINSEGFSRTVLEAMLHERAVVASAVVGIPEQIVDGETGLLVPPSDPAALARALDTLAGDAALRERLGAAAGRRVRERFTVRRMVEGTMRVYEGLRSG